MLIADLPYGENVNVTVKDFLTVVILFNEKYCEMNETAKPIIEIKNIKM
jgi:hypothetical protein